LIYQNFSGDLNIKIIFLKDNYYKNEREFVYNSFVGEGNFCVK